MTEYIKGNNAIVSCNHVVALVVTHTEPTWTLQALTTEWRIDLQSFALREEATAAMCTQETKLRHQ